MGKSKRWFPYPMVMSGVAVRKPTCTSDGVTEVERHFFSSLPSPFPGLKRARYPFTAG